MRKRPVWLLPAVTCLFIAAAVLIPPGLSRLEDRQLGASVHPETLAGDNNFSVWNPTAAERAALVVRWLSGGAGEVSSVTRELTGADPEAARALLAAQLEALAEADVLPKELIPAELPITASRRTYLWTGRNLGSISVLTLDAYSEADNWQLSVMMDEESGQFFELVLLWPGREYDSEEISPAGAGAGYLDGLELEYQLLGSARYQAFFALDDGETGFQCIGNSSHFVILFDKLSAVQENCALCFGYKTWDEMMEDAERIHPIYVVPVPPADGQLSAAQKK